MNPSTMNDQLIKKDLSLVMSDGNRGSNISGMFRGSSGFGGQLSNNATPNQSQLLDKIMLNQYVNMRKESI